MFSTTYNYLFSVLHIFVNLWDIRCQLWTTGMQLQFYGQAHILNVCNQLTNPWEAYTCSPSHGHKRLPIGRSRLRRSPPVPGMVTWSAVATTAPIRRCRTNPPRPIKTTILIRCSYQLFCTSMLQAVPPNESWTAADAAAAVYFPFFYPSADLRHDPMQQVKCK